VKWRVMLMGGRRPSRVCGMGWVQWWAGWSEVSMKILTYNVRGLGGCEKRKEVRQLVLEKHPLVLCLQETKL